jgi:hypothetical protein
MLSKVSVDVLIDFGLSQICIERDFGLGFNGEENTASNE